MNATRSQIATYLLRDLALLRRLGTPQEREEIPHFEKLLELEIETAPSAVSFATTTAEPQTEEAKS